VATLLQKLRRTLMGVPPKKATSFSRGNSESWKHLEAVVLTALEGYHLTLDSSKFEVLIPHLDEIPLAMRSYAYEGAAMGLMGLDMMLPWKKRLRAYMAGPGAPHIYMVHIGVGEALALMNRNPEPFIAALEDRVICWLAMEGYGFHKGFFHRKRYIAEQKRPRRFSPYGQRIFDQGLGRCVWFLEGANVERIAATLAKFPASRQADMWVGIGVACTYVGGVDRQTVQALQEAAGSYELQMAVGAAFVAKGRQLAGNPVPHTDLVCGILWGASADQVAEKTTRAFQDLPLDGPEPAFEILQQRLLEDFALCAEPAYQQKESNS
jgi:enediyne biosynthesis protein E3